MNEQKGNNLSWFRFTNLKNHLSKFAMCLCTASMLCFAQLLPIPSQSSNRQRHRLPSPLPSRNVVCGCRCRSCTLDAEVLFTRVSLNVQTVVCRHRASHGRRSCDPTSDALFRKAGRKRRTPTYANQTVVFVRNVRSIVCGCVVSVYLFANNRRRKCVL